MRLIPASAGQTTRALRTQIRTPAHPRECGADQNIDGWEFDVSGSSPRVRGRQTTPTMKDDSDRLIPASAGQTSSRQKPAPSPKAHPRECGADVTLGNVSPGRWGSSPRVRGRPKLLEPQQILEGLIPASAGQTRLCRRGRSVARAHPRECGADTARPRRCTATPGSSPRVRGRHGAGLVHLVAHGLIPASAGQTGDSPAKTPA